MADKNQGLDTLTYEHILLVNEMHELLDGGSELTKLIQTACDGLKKIHNFTSVLLFLSYEDEETHESYLKYTYHNINNTLLNVAEKLTGLNAGTMRIPLFEGSKFRSIYENQVPYEFQDKKEIVMLVQDMVSPDKTHLRRFAPQVVDLMSMHYCYMVPLVVSGKAIGHIGTFRDDPLSLNEKQGINMVTHKIAEIIARKRIEASLNESELRYSQLFSQLLDCFLLLKVIRDKKRKPSDFRYIDVNPVYEKVLNTKKDKLIGKSLKDGKFLDDEELLLQLNQILIEKKSIRFEWFSKKANKFYQVVGFYPKEDEIAVILTDISERKNSEKLLNEVFDLNQRIIGASVVGIMVYRKSGECILANDAAAKIMNTDVDSLVCQNFLKLASWKNSGLLDEAKKVLEGKTNKQVEIHHVPSTDRELWLDCYLSSFKSNEDDHLLLIINDITERKNAEARLKVSQERLELALFAANQGLYDMDLVSGEFYVSPEYCKMLGYDPQQFKENFDSWMDRMHPEDRNRVMGYFDSYIRGELHSFRVEFRQLTKSGAWLWLLSQGNIVQWNNGGEPVRLAGTNTDISERKKIERELIEAREALEIANKELETKSITDALTGISNRRYFNDILEKEWLRARRNSTPLSLIMCDIDYFKLYNDHYGHLKGDDCLMRVARAINNTIKRPPDIAARYGGEEFVVLLPETSLDGAETVAELVRKNVAGLKILHEKSNVSPYVTISIGVATLIPDRVMPMNSLIELADKVLYQAKKCGRNKVCKDKS